MLPASDYAYDPDSTSYLFDEEELEEQPITLPYRYEPRPYQCPIWDAHFLKGIKRIVKIWHRRAGKDKNIWNMFIAATQQDVGVYYYMLPTIAQARKVIYEGIDNAGMRFIDHIPDDLVVHHDKGEMKWELINGSIIRLLGSDNYDSIVGTNPKGIVFSEWALCNPISWDFFRPILKLNGGWAWFVYTPRGRNHGYNTYEIAKRQHGTKWYLSYLDINATGLLTDQDVQDEIDDGMDADTAEQEFYLSFDAATKGAYYAKQTKDIYQQGRYKEFDIEPGVQVQTFWDLGISDAMAIGFVQVIGGEPRLIHYYENTDEGMGHYANYLLDFAKKYSITYSRHWGPHDLKVRELTNGQSRMDTARKMGITFTLVEMMPVADGIEAVRRLLPCMWFRKERAKSKVTEGGRDQRKVKTVSSSGVEFFMACMSNYHKKYNEKTKTFSSTPEHDWSSHCADMARMMAQAFKQNNIKFKVIKQKPQDTMQAVKKKQKGYVSPIAKKRKPPEKKRYQGRQRERK